MIILRKYERQHIGDYNHFIHEKDEDIYKVRTIRNSCLDLISGLIEVFGDLAVESILFVIENLFLTTNKEDASPSKLSNSQATSVEEVNIYEFTYSSTHKKHSWKKREVALFLVGNFAEDISMYRQRNPSYNLKNLIESIISIDFSKALMRSYMEGRTLWCASQFAEIIPKDYTEINMGILNSSVQILIEQKVTSVKLIATRCIIKFSRKIKNDILATH